MSFVVSAMGSLLTRAAPRCLMIGRRLLSYLQRSKTLALRLMPVGEEFVAYSDSSFAPSGSRSHTGIVLTWMNTPISWRACKQPFTCLSTAECELVAAIEALTMASSLQTVIQQLDATSQTIILGIDNQAAIALASPTTSASWRTRHLRVRASFIHEQIQAKNVALRYVPGKDQWADLLTKSFPRQRLSELTTLWGFVDTVTEVAKVAAVRTLLLCHLVQTARAQKKDPLPLDGSFELYVMIVLVGIALIAAWEVLWWIWDRCGTTSSSTRSARRLRNVQEAVQRELLLQMAQRDAGPAGGTASSSAASIPEKKFTRMPKKTTVDASTQTTNDEDYVPIVEYLDRDVPVYR